MTPPPLLQQTGMRKNGADEKLTEIATALYQASDKTTEEKWRYSLPAGPSNRPKTP